MIAVDSAALDWLATLPPPRTLTGRQAIEAVRRLGGLAPWWLRPAVLQRAASRADALADVCRPPALPGNSLGACWIVLETKRPAEVLRPAVLLPLRWQPDSTHGDCLPPALRTLAEQVVEQLDAPGWGLHLHDEAGLARVDLSRLTTDEATVESGWAAVAGGLVLARQGRPPRTDVWASAAWHPKFGIGPVKGLPAKLDLAREWGVTRMFVPTENEREALEALAGSDRGQLEVLRPMPRQPGPVTLLRAYLASLGAEPDASAPLHRRKQHYSNIDRREADDYYWRCLLGDAVSRCGEDLRRADAAWRPTHVVTVVSNTPSIVALGPLAVGAKHCLLLHEESEPGQVPVVIQKSLDLVSKRLQEQGVTVVPGPLRVGEREQERARIRGHLQAFRGTTSAEQVVYDLTPGYKSLSLELAEHARPGSWLIYCRHRQMEPDNRVEPETERYDRWRRE